MIYPLVREMAAPGARVRVPVAVTCRGMWPLLVSKLRGLGVSLGLPLACPSFSGPESFFGGDAGVVLFGAAPERNGARLA